MGTAPSEPAVPASSQPAVPDSHNSSIPNTIKGHEVSNEMWQAVAMLPRKDQNMVTREVEPIWSAPDGYDVEAVLDAQLKALHLLDQRQGQRDLQPEM